MCSKHSNTQTFKHLERRKCHTLKLWHIQRLKNTKVSRVLKHVKRQVFDLWMFECVILWNVWIQGCLNVWRFEILNVWLLNKVAKVMCKHSNNQEFKTANWQNSSKIQTSKCVKHSKSQWLDELRFQTLDLRAWWVIWKPCEWFEKPWSLSTAWGLIWAPE